MVKKCNCKKCIYCALICTSTSVPRIDCKRMGTDMVMPAYCDQYTTTEEFLSPEFIEKLAEFFALPQRLVWDESKNKQKQENK